MISVYTRCNFLRCELCEPRSVSSQVRVSAGSTGRYIHMWCCGALSLVLLQLKDPLELFIKREFLLAPGFYLVAI